MYVGKHEDQTWFPGHSLTLFELHVFVLLSGNESACQLRGLKRCGLDNRIGKIPWRRPRHPTPVLLPGESHGRRSPAGYSPWGRTD